MAETLNIQVGDHISMVCRMIRRGKTNQIGEHFIFQTPAGAVSDGTIANVEMFAKKLTEEIERHGLKKITDVNFCISSSKIASREAVIPKVKEKQIQSLIMTNLKDYFPMDMSGYKITYTMLGEMTGETPGYRIIIRAAQKEMLNSYVSLAKAALLRINSIECTENALFQAVKDVKMQGNVMYMNISAVRTECTFMKDGEFKLHRSFNDGGDCLLTPYMENSFIESEEYIPTCEKLLDPQQTMMDRETAEDYLSRLVSNVNRAVDFYASTTKSSVDGIVLLGPCEHLPHFREVLKDGTGVDVAYIEQLQEVAEKLGKVVEVSTFVTCFAASISPVNFIPDEYLASRKKTGLAINRGPKNVQGASEDSYTSAIIIALVCVAAGVILSLVSVLGYLDSKGQLADAEEEIEQLQPAKKTYEDYMVYSKNDEALSYVKEDARGNNAKLRKFFEECERKMPKSLLFLSAQLNSSGAVLECETSTDLKDVANVIHEFRSFTSIEVIKVSTPEVVESSAESGVPTEKFTLTVVFNDPHAQAKLEQEGNAAGNTSGTTTTTDTTATTNESQAGGEKQ